MAVANAAKLMVVSVCVAVSALPALAQTAEPSRPPLPPIESLQETIERPLFRPDRRPPAIEEPEEEDENPESGLICLLGTSISPTERIALVKVRGSQEVLQLSEGQQVNGWTVLQILPGEVIIASHGKTETIELTDKKLPPPRKRPPARERRPRPQNDEQKK